MNRLLALVVVCTVAVWQPVAARNTMPWCTTRNYETSEHAFDHNTASNEKACYTRCNYHRYCWVMSFNRNNNRCYMYRPGCYSLYHDTNYITHSYCLGGIRCRTNNCVGSWSRWSSCSKQCAGGTQTRTRSQRSECRILTCGESKRDTRTCNEACPHGGYVQNHACVCPFNRAGTCCDIVISCSSIAAPANGKVHIGGITAGSISKLSCNEGYRHTAGDANLVCQKKNNQGVWKGATSVAFQCDKIRCQLTELSPHLKILNTQSNGYAFSEHVVFICETGFELDGPSSRECTESGFTGYTPTCPPVTCPHPSVPANGERIGEVFTFQSDVTFSCEHGYQLVGSEVVKCTAYKNWSGSIPTCEVITCTAPYVPLHGSIQISHSSPTQDFNGEHATFSCETGYELHGSMKISCLNTGIWNSSEPSCNLKECLNPGALTYGEKLGNIYTYTSEIAFTCIAGYTLTGKDKIQCLASKEWSADKPTCTPCPKDYYSGNNNDCLPCQLNSHTESVATRYKTDCKCDQHFTLVESGKCISIKCTDLPTPENSHLVACNVRVGETCNFSCDDGYVPHSGSSARLCQENGAWSSSQLLCHPCSKDTYKDGNMCEPCPPNSETFSGGTHNVTGCLCKVRYTGDAGGPCEDLNECAENDGRGPCEQACLNSIGGFECTCTRYGYVVDLQYPDKCRIDQECKNLTEIEVPVNGGAVCKWFPHTSSQFCQTKCNPGFEHTLGVNDYETCGPTTNFMWSFRVISGDATEPLPGCYLSEFPEIRLEADMFYFTKDCDLLTEDDKQEVYAQFNGLLTSHQVCEDRRSQSQACNIDTNNMAIICGRKTTRRRRSADGTITHETGQELNMAMNITAIKSFLNKTELGPQHCPMLRLNARLCNDSNNIHEAMGRFIKRAIQIAELKLKRAMKAERMNGMEFQAAGRDFMPVEDGVATNLRQGCPPGYSDDNDKCVPCQPGTHFDAATATCLPCPLGTFTYLTKELSCRQCHTGMTTKTVGSKTCYSCDEGFWGENCTMTCDCVHGECDTYGGKCRCTAGWEGDACDQDIPGCRYSPCFTGVTCYDLPAPSEGYRCGDCPAGYRGDGELCILPEPTRRRRDLHLFLHEAL